MGDGNVLQDVGTLHLEDNQREVLKLDRVFAKIGLSQLRAATDLVERNERPETAMNAHSATSAPGLFAVEEVTNRTEKQISGAAGHGAGTALSK